ncbi:unnamed protein product [Effrenium voratum]|nr:unnamed protein product [Effrenium voratum]
MLLSLLRVASWKGECYAPRTPEENNVGPGVLGPGGRLEGQVWMDPARGADLPCQGQYAAGSSVHQQDRFGWSPRKSGQEVWKRDSMFQFSEQVLWHRLLTFCA